MLEVLAFEALWGCRPYVFTPSTVGNIVLSGLSAAEALRGTEGGPEEGGSNIGQNEGLNT